MGKYINTLFAVLMAIAVMLFISCNEKLDSNGIEIGTNGIGDIRFGVKISELPKQSEGLYDNIIVEKVGDVDFDEHILYTFTLNGLPTVKVEDYEQNGTISNIKLVSPIAHIGGISPGMAVEDLLQKKDVPQVFHNDGGFFFETKNCLITINEFSQSGYDKRQQAYMTGKDIILTEDDFTENSVVESIICQAGNDAGNYTKTSSRDKDWWVDVLILLVFIAIYAAMAVHMIKVHESKDEERVFTGSKWRMALFVPLMSLGFFVEGLTVSSFMALFVATPIILCVYYYACMTPKRIIIKNGFSENAFHWIGGMWASSENRKRNDVLIKDLEERRDKMTDDKYYVNNREDKLEMDRKIDGFNSRINEEKYRTEEHFMMIVVTIFITAIFVWFTPFSAIGSYLKNYIFYRSKKE